MKLIKSLFRGSLLAAAVVLRFSPLAMGEEKTAGNKFPCDLSYSNLSSPEKTGEGFSAPHLENGMAAKLGLQPDSVQGSQPGEFLSYLQERIGAGDEISLLTVEGNSLVAKRGKISGVTVGKGELKVFLNGEPVVLNPYATYLVPKKGLYGDEGESNGVSFAQKFLVGSNADQVSQLAKDKFGVSGGKPAQSSAPLSMASETSAAATPWWASGKNSEVAASKPPLPASIPSQPSIGSALRSNSGGAGFSRSLENLDLKKLRPAPVDFTGTYPFHSHLASLPLSPEKMREIVTKAGEELDRAYPVKNRAFAFGMMRLPDPSEVSPGQFWSLAFQQAATRGLPALVSLIRQIPDLEGNVRLEKELLSLLKQGNASEVASSLEKALLPE